ncbi:MAG: hypothetical protein FJ316_10175 [SAR202 cluster bacterium]|nr:hypothetical protein [SAR202 cluster bacterium]
MRAAALLLALAALLLPVLGPVVDHHFAEREPGHVHIYVGPALPTHLHPYEQSHGHQHDPNFIISDSDQPQAPGAPVAFLPDHDSGLQAGPDTVAPTLRPQFAPAGATENLLAGNTRPAPFLTGTSPSPQPRPPLS